MTPFTEIACRCGRLVRVSPEQGGTAVRCWNCGSDVQVPERGAIGEIFAEFAATAARNALRPPALGAFVGVSLVTTAILMIPYVGNWLALGVLIVGARLYQEMIREVTPPARAGGPSDESAEEGPPDWAEWVISALAVVGMLSPFLVRSWSPGLILPIRWVLLALAFACGLIVPVVLYASNARDRRGVVPPRLALAALTRHPAATAAALFVVPMGFCLLEAATVSIVKAEGVLTRLIDDLFLAPRLGKFGDLVGSHYRFDDRRIAVPLGSESDEALRLYRTALSRGFTLVGSVPRSLSRGLEASPHAVVFLSLDVAYLALRAALTILILTGACIVFSIQARWLGLIALLGTRRSAADDSQTPKPPRPLPAAVQAPAPFPIPIPIPIPMPVPVPVPPLPQTFAALSEATAAPTRVPGVRTILILDGDRGFAVNLGRILSGRGFGVILAGSASEAMAITRGARPDLIVLDTMLPDRSGIQFCHELRAAMPGADRPVLIATTQTASAAGISAMAIAADDYLLKPYVIEALILRINQHLKSRS